MLSRIFNIGIKQYLAYRQKRISAIRDRSPELQASLLHALLTNAVDTEWGKLNRLKEIKTSDEFDKAIPLSNYESVKPYIDRMMMGEADILTPGVTTYFAKSAGTTSGRSKYLPVPKRFLQENMIDASWESMSTVYDIRPSAQNFQEKNLILGGSLEKYGPYENTIIGDVSAIMLDSMPSAGRPFYCPDFETALMAEWETKLDKIAQISIKENIVMFAGVPTWNIVLFKKILALTGKSNILEVWPNLKTYMHGGVGFEPYIEKFKELIPATDFDYIEIYNASEGYFAIQDTKSVGMLLLTDHGVYYEFIPIEEIDDANPTILNIDQVQLHQIYALVISTYAGLWRYVIGDTVRFTSVNPYRIKVVGRIQQYLNVFGEEVMVGNTDQAIAEVSKITGAKIKDYTVGPIFMSDQNKGGHEWFIEFEKNPGNINLFAKLLDDHLQKLNSDYTAKRYKDIALMPLKINVLPNGSFQKWLTSKGKVGAQIKVPRLSNSRKYLEELNQITSI